MEKFSRGKGIRYFVLMNGILIGLFLSSYAMATVWKTPKNNGDNCPANHVIEWTPEAGTTSQGITVMRADNMDIIDNCYNGNLSSSTGAYACDWSGEQNLDFVLIQIDAVVNGGYETDYRACKR